MIYFVWVNKMKKIICLIVCVCILFCLFSVLAYAQAEKEYYVKDAFCIEVDIDAPFILSDLSCTGKIDFFSSANKNKNFNAYNLLNDNQKKIYDAVKNSEPGIMSVSVAYESGLLHINDLTNDFLSAVTNAICYDLPQFFYHSGCKCSYSYNASGYITRIDYVFSLINVKLQTDAGQINVLPTYTESTVAECYDELQRVLDNLEFDTSNRYNFVKSVHDYLCNNVIYPDIPSDKYVGECHDAYGALVNGYAVCQGYAEAFKLICDKYKIPCIYISGTANGGNHGWNAVQMDDGKWYLIDITWDDQGSYLFYDYFLCGLNSVDTYFGGNAFSASHVASAAQLIPSLWYATDYYSQTNHYTKFAATYNNFADETNKLLYLSVFDAGKSNIYYNGIYVDVQSFTTGESFNVNDSGEMWEIVVLGDTNNDGLCDVNDYSATVNKSISSIGEVTNINDRTSDINRDGYIDVLDVSSMALMSSGKNTDLTIE